MPLFFIGRGNRQRAFLKVKQSSLPHDFDFHRVVFGDEYLDSMVRVRKSTILESHCRDLVLITFQWTKKPLSLILNGKTQTWNKRIFRLNRPHLYTTTHRISIRIAYLSSTISHLILTASNPSEQEWMQ